MRRPTHRIRILAAATAALCVLLSAGAPCLAFEDVPYASYSYQKGQGAETPVAMKALFEVDRVIEAADLGLDEIDTPTSLCTDAEGRIYVLESGYGRVLVLDEDYSLIRTIMDFAGPDGLLDLTGAVGISVDADGEMLIADAANHRVVVTDPAGGVLRTIESPESDLIPDSFVFAPIKAIQDSRGYTYVVSQGSFYGALIFDQDDRFLGFYGANRVTTNILTSFQRLVDLLFKSKVKRQSEIRQLPYEFNDLCIDTSDFLFTVTGSTPSGTGQIKKLSPGGYNVLTYKGSHASYSAEYFRFGDIAGFIRDNGTPIANRFVSISIDGTGLIYALDAEYGKVFLYDTDCNLLTAFGGGLRDGEQKGTFRNASSLVVNGEEVVVADADKGTLTVFRPTAFGRAVLEAQRLTLLGEYEKSLPLWQDVLRQDRYLQLAYRGLARAEMLSGDHEAAMRDARTGSDRDTYALSYEVVRREYINRNFAWIFLLVVVLLGAVAYLVRRSIRHPEIRMIRDAKLRVLASTLVHPIETFKAVKYSGMGSVPLALGVLLAFYAVSTLREAYGGFLFTSFDPYQYSSLFTLLGTVGIVILWTVSNWAVSTLFEGKGRMREIFVVSCYALLPLVLARLVDLGLSYVLLPAESQLMSLLLGIAGVAMGFCMVLAVMVVHEYSFARSIVMSAATVAGVALVIFLIVLVLTLFQDLIGFLTGVFWEVTIRGA